MRRGIIDRDLSPPGIKRPRGSAADIMADLPIIVLTTVGTSEDARRIAGQLVENRLAACVNIIDGVTSVYRWQGKVMEERELILLIKSVEDRLAELKDAIYSLHPYEVPEFIVIDPTSVASPYREWLVTASKEDA